MRRCWRVAIALLLAGPGGSIAGCRGSGETWTARPHEPSNGESSAAGALAESTAWPYAPASMRVHPLTRRVDSTSGASLPSASADAASRTDLEVRIECLDSDGHETRAIGSLVIELVGGGARWTVGPIDLSDAEINRRIFEGTTRTYRVGVAMPQEASLETGTVLSIEARLRLPEGRVLEASFELPWR